MKDHCKAIDLILLKFRIGEIYKASDYSEKRNIDIVFLVCRESGKPENNIWRVADRKGQDRQYTIDPAKI